MRRRLWMNELLPACLCTGLLVLAPRSALAQSPPVLSVQLSNGAARLGIAAAVGTVCEIQYLTDLAQTNTWLRLTNLTLVHNPHLWVDTSGPVAGRRFYRAMTVVTNQPLTNMVLIPAGTFTMGNSMNSEEGSSGELPLHTVYVSAFLMDQYLVTLDLWFSVQEWSVDNGYDYHCGGQAGPAGIYPVTSLDWYDAVTWCNARSQIEGLTPCYYLDAQSSNVYKGVFGEYVNPYICWSANGYRLPTEAEWEKAARGGLSGRRFPWGDTISDDQANYFSCSSCYSYDLSNTGYNPIFNGGTNPVGYFAPNGYGLYDMAGNVWEWCWDWHDDQYYYASPDSDPHGPDSSPHHYRVLRGGSWRTEANALRCAARGYDYNASETTGFRCVRAP
jgi:formylglycine-generating enzyme required for sulfatase activity